MKATKCEKKNERDPMQIDMLKFAHVSEAAITEACVSGFDKGWTPVQMCEFELKLWAAANIIGNKLFSCEPMVDFSDGRMEKVKGELENGVWSSAEVKNEN